MTRNSHNERKANRKVAQRESEANESTAAKRRDEGRVTLHYHPSEKRKKRSFFRRESPSSTSDCCWCVPLCLLRFVQLHRIYLPLSSIPYLVSHALSARYSFFLLLLLYVLVFACICVTVLLLVACSPLCVFLITLTPFSPRLAHFPSNTSHTSLFSFSFLESSSTPVRDKALHPPSLVSFFSFVNS